MASRFVYVTFIKASPETLWSALTDPAFTRRYWFGMHQDCTWEAGSSWALMYPDGRIADAGEIVEVDAPRRLVIKWGHELRPELKAEGFAQCVMELEPVGKAVKLTITHSMERDESQLIEAVSGGWPRILSNLKSLLETGSVALPDR